MQHPRSHSHQLNGKTQQLPGNLSFHRFKKMIEAKSTDSFWYQSVNNTCVILDDDEGFSKFVAFGKTTGTTVNMWLHTEVCKSKLPRLYRLTG